MPSFESGQINKANRHANQGGKDITISGNVHDDISNNKVEFYGQNIKAYRTQNQTIKEPFTQRKNINSVSEMYEKTSNKYPIGILKDKLESMHESWMSFHFGIRSQKSGNDYDKKEGKQ